MRNSQTIQQKGKLTRRLSKFFEKAFLDQKLNNWLGYLIFFFIAVVLGYLMAQKTLVGLGVIGLVCGLAVILTCLFNTEAGLYINMTYSFFASFFSRLFFNGELQVGVFSDILIVATLFSFFVKNVNLKQSIDQFSKTSIVICLLLVYGYTAVELFNPNAHSFAGWFNAFRKILGTLLLLFIAYNVFDSFQRIKRFITVLFILCTITALYGCVQQWHGLFSFEYIWAISDWHRFGLLYLDGDFKKFSTMSDPTAFGMIMASCSVFFIILTSGIKRTSTRIKIISGVIPMLLAMGYSGTRTANAMIVGGLALYILLTINKKNTKILAIVSGVVFLVLLYGPFHNASIDRFRTTFIGEDASYGVRERNRNRIQPYIYSHPVGGGLGTTGGAGETYNPGHYLAGFPPDSGYLTKALEMGWIGLIFFCTLDFIILRSGIRGYFASKKEDTRLIYGACTAAIFSFYVGELTQVAIGQISDIVVYYPFIAIILKLKNFDQTKTLTA
jgi:putative inorganic carbon (hco3(-)) transporter